MAFLAPTNLAAHKQSKLQSALQFICNLDERLANLTLSGRLNKVLNGRKNLSKNIVLAHPNQRPCSRVLVRWRPEIGVHWK